MYRNSKFNLKNQRSFYNFLLPENKEFVGQSATMFCLLGLFFINGSGLVKKSFKTKYLHNLTYYHLVAKCQCNRKFIINFHQARLRSPQTSNHKLNKVGKSWDILFSEKSLLCELNLCQLLLHLDIKYHIRKFYTSQFQSFINGFVLH